jgi:hypothetical protein
VILYIKYHNQISSPDLEPINLPPIVSSQALETAVITQAVICVGIGLSMLMWPEPNVEAPLGIFICYIFFTGYIHFLLALASLVIAIYQYIPQIRAVIALQDLGSISILSLILQVVFFFVMGISQALRLSLKGNRQDMSFRWFKLYLHVG